MPFDFFLWDALLLLKVTFRKISKIREIISYLQKEMYNFNRAPLGDAFEGLLPTLLVIFGVSLN